MKLPMQPESLGVPPSPGNGEERSDHRAKRVGSRPKSQGWVFHRLLLQIGVAAAILAGWQFVPEIHWVSGHYRFSNKFFISSPTNVAKSIGELFTGHNATNITIWPYLQVTVVATLEGVVIGLLLGALAGLIFSNSLRLSDVIRPFIVMANTVPRVAIIPIIVVIVGPTASASVVSVVTVVFFLAFFNAFEGGRSVSPQILENARLLGGSPFAIMRLVRLPRVIAWTFDVIPNAISFGLVVAVTTEVIAGVRGVGQILLAATLNLDASLTFALVVILSVIGLLLDGAARKLRDRVLRWEVREQ